MLKQDILINKILKISKLFKVLSLKKRLLITRNDEFKI